MAWLLLLASGMRPMDSGSSHWLLDGWNGALVVVLCVPGWVIVEVFHLQESLISIGCQCRILQPDMPQINFYRSALVFYNLPKYDLVTVPPGVSWCKCCFDCFNCSRVNVNKLKSHILVLKYFNKTHVSNTLIMSNYGFWHPDWTVWMYMYYYVYWFCEH